MLSLTFDVEAATFDLAAASARSGIEALAKALGLPGRLLPLKGYTETHQFTDD